jgi:hypothetical protein
MMINTNNNGAAPRLGGRGSNASSSMHVPVSFQDWAATRVQAAFRMHQCRRRFAYRQFFFFAVAAHQMQRAWADYRQRRYAATQSSTTRQHAAVAMQRAWRSYVNKRVYRYFRDLILFRQKSEPVSLIRALVPQEAELIDQHAGLYVRFRLGGVVSPPIIYYKIFTSHAVTDICSFAPRDYTKSRRHRAFGRHVRTDDELKAGGAGGGAGGGSLGATGGGGAVDTWYKRWENNGWRPITSRVLAMSDDDPIVTETRAQVRPYHFSKLVRQIDLTRKRKNQKLQWMQKMYKLNKAVDASNENDSGGGGDGDDAPDDRNGGGGGGGKQSSSDGVDGEGKRKHVSYGTYLRRRKAHDKAYDRASSRRARAMQTVIDTRDGEAASEMEMKDGGGNAGAGGKGRSGDGDDDDDDDALGFYDNDGGNGNNKEGGVKSDGAAATDEARERAIARLLALKPGAREVAELDWEDEADELLDWSASLDFETYQNSWFSVATSRPIDRNIRAVNTAVDARSIARRLREREEQMNMRMREDSDEFDDI